MAGHQWGQGHRPLLELLGQRARSGGGWAGEGFRGMAHGKVEVTRRGIITLDVIIRQGYYAP